MVRRDWKEFLWLVALPAPLKLGKSHSMKLIIPKLFPSIHGLRVIPKPRNMIPSKMRALRSSQRTPRSLWQSLPAASLSHSRRQAAWRCRRAASEAGEREPMFGGKSRRSKTYLAHDLPISAFFLIILFFLSSFSFFCSYFFNDCVDVYLGCSVLWLVR